MHVCIGVVYLNNATYEHVISLVVNPVLQHHFVYHGDEDLVLKIRGQRRGVNKRVFERFMWFSLATFFLYVVSLNTLVLHTCI